MADIEELKMLLLRDADTNALHRDAADVIASQSAEIARLKGKLEEARNDEREKIGCFLVALGHHDLAGQVFAPMTRTVNDERRGAAFDSWIVRQQQGEQNNVR